MSIVPSASWSSFHSSAGYSAGRRGHALQIQKCSLKAWAVNVLRVVAPAAVLFSRVSETRHRKIAVQSQNGVISYTVGVARHAALDRPALQCCQLLNAAIDTLARQRHLAPCLTEAPAGTANPMLSEPLEAALNTNPPASGGLNATLQPRVTTTQ